jgi:hypothetical protein
MITPKAFPTWQARIADLWRRLTLTPAAFEEERVSAIHHQMGGAISREEVRRIVRAHRI